MNSSVLFKIVEFSQRRKDIYLNFAGLEMVVHGNLTTSHSEPVPEITLKP